MTNDLKHLKAIQTLPFCIPGGRLVTQVGWDRETGLYLHLPHDYASNIPAEPTRDHLRAALVRLVAPWRAYRWASPDDAAGLVSAVLASVCRAALDLCPATLFDASQQGSGKTLGAVALGSLLTGRREGVSPFSGFDDDELRKALIAGVLAGQQFHCLDNLIGHVTSPCLAAVLTAGRVQGRVLGASRTVDASIRAMITMTSNNASLSADLLRRTVRVRVDSGLSPITRRFEFSPPDEALRDRLSIAEAACVIWRAYFNAGAPRIADDDAGGFVEWVMLCRQPVLWIAREGVHDMLGWELGDPAASMLALAENHDPEVETHGDMLRAIYALTEGSDFSAHEALQWAKAGEHADHMQPAAMLRDAVTEMIPGRTLPTARSLGRCLGFRRDRAVGGLVLRQRGLSRGGAAYWAVSRVTA